MVFWNNIGTGTHSVKMLEKGTSNVLTSKDVVSGRNSSSLTNIPAFATNSIKFYKLQAKSTTGVDDPVLEYARMYLK